MNGVAKARRRPSLHDVGEHNIAITVTLPLDLSDLSREWQAAERCRVVANQRLKQLGGLSPNARTGVLYSADAAAMRASRAREAFASAMRAEAEERA